MWPKPHNYKEHVRPFQRPACISYTRHGLTAPVKTGVVVNDIGSNEVLPYCTYKIKRNVSDNITK